MTLGDWLRNYLYFPLGGSRQGLLRTCVNLMIIMLIAGVWHGAGWGFIVWGALQGLFLVIHRLAIALSDQWSLLKRWWESLPGTLLAWAITQAAVFFAWIFFRLPDLSQSTLVIQRLWGHQADIQFAQKIYVETLQSDRPQITLLLWGLVGLMAIAYGATRWLKLQLNWTLKILLVPVCLLAAWLLAPNDSPPYIYFDF